MCQDLLHPPMIVWQDSICAVIVHLLQPMGVILGVFPLSYFYLSHPSPQYYVKYVSLRANINWFNMPQPKLILILCVWAILNLHLVWCWSIVCSLATCFVNLPQPIEHNIGGKVHNYWITGGFRIIFATLLDYDFRCCGRTCKHIKSKYAPHDSVSHK